MEQQRTLDSLSPACLRAGAIHSFWRASAGRAVADIGYRSGEDPGPDRGGREPLLRCRDDPQGSVVPKIGTLLEASLARGIAHGSPPQAPLGRKLCFFRVDFVTRDGENEVYTYCCPACGKRYTIEAAEPPLVARRSAGRRQPGEKQIP